MRDPRSIRRDTAAALGVEAVQITHDGRYTAPSGRVVDIAAYVERAIEATTSFPPNTRIPLPSPGAFTTRVSARNESTLEAARRLRDADLDPAALNFASARNPGGGFLKGARAQEESLCRASALYACIVNAPMYAHHTQLRDPLYTAWLLYSPGVPVFRDDDGALLESPWRCAFVTAPAPNTKVFRERSPERLDVLAPTFDLRIERVLATAAREGHRSVVLGAWGCGAFGGDAEMVAERFDRALDGAFRGVFEEVVFAVLDTSDAQHTLGPFARRFGRE